METLKPSDAFGIGDVVQDNAGRRWQVLDVLDQYDCLIVENDHGTVARLVPSPDLQSLSLDAILAFPEA